MYFKQFSLSIIFVPTTIPMSIFAICISKVKHGVMLLLAGLLVCSTTLLTVRPASSETLIPIVVESGTNLIKIAEKFCTSRFHWKELAAINHLRDPFVLYPGDKILVPLELLKAETVYAQIASVSGEVVLVRNEKILKKLKKGDLIYPGQSVVTGEGSYAHLVFPDHRYTRIAEDSKFTVTYFLKVADQGIKAEFFLEKGRITHDIQQRLHQTETFTTRTPVSVTGVRGTEYRLKMASATSNIVETLKGNVVVAAQGRQQVVAGNQGSKVAKDKAPSPPRALPKMPNISLLDKTYKVLPISIPVPENGVSDVVSYRMRITTDRDGSTTVQEKAAPHDGSFTIAELSDGNYYTFFTAIDSESFESIPTQPIQFVVRTIPAAPVLALSHDNKTLFADEIKLQWLNGREAEKYLVELATDQGFNDIIDSSETTETNFAFRNLTPQTYYARITAIAADGFHSLYSMADSWTIVKTPDIGELSGSGESGLHIAWAASGAADMTYDLQVSRNEDFSDIFINVEGLEEPKYSFTKELQPDTYYIRIRGVLADGTQGPWCAAQVLKIPSGPLTWLDGLFLAGLTALIIIL